MDKKGIGMSLTTIVGVMIILIVVIVILISMYGGEGSFTQKVARISEGFANSVFRGGGEDTPTNDENVVQARIEYVSLRNLFEANLNNGYEKCLVPYNYQEFEKKYRVNFVKTEENKMYIGFTDPTGKIYQTDSPLDTVPCAVIDPQSVKFAENWEIDNNDRGSDIDFPIPKTEFIEVDYHIQKDDGFWDLSKNDPINLNGIEYMWLYQTKKEAEASGRESRVYFYKPTKNRLCIVPMYDKTSKCRLTIRDHVGLTKGCRTSIMEKVPICGE